MPRALTDCEVWRAPMLPSQWLPSRGCTVEHRYPGKTGSCARTEVAWSTTTRHRYIDAGGGDDSTLQPFDVFYADGTSVHGHYIGASIIDSKQAVVSTMAVGLATRIVECSPDKFSWYERLPYDGLLGLAPANAAAIAGLKLSPSFLHTLSSPNVS